MVAAAAETAAGTCVVESGSAKKEEGPEIGIGVCEVICGANGSPLYVG